MRFEIYGKEIHSAKGEFGGKRKLYYQKLKEFDLESHRQKYLVKWKEKSTSLEIFIEQRYD